MKTEYKIKYYDYKRHMTRDYKTTNSAVKAFYYIMRLKLKDITKVFVEINTYFLLTR